MAFSTRKSTMAIIKETTENTPVYPSSGSQYIALQDGYSVEANIATLESSELKGSIGKAPSISGGLESPTASFSHYMRHSGVEGTEPNFGVAIEAAFGAKVVNGTEYPTVAGSTAGTSSVRAAINVNTGIGANFQRGQALLIKDGVNGYSIRPIYSVAGDVLSLGFNLANAPASGVNLGKCIEYKPNDIPPTLSVWDFRANEAAIQMVSGARVSELSIEANAGELLNASFSLDGAGYYFDPINITATDTYLDFLDNVTVRAAQVPAKIYKDPHQLASSIASAMNGLGSANTFTCTYSDSTGKFTIASNGSTLTLKWNTGANAANTIGDKIGFNTAADSSAALTYTSANAQVWSAPQTIALDSGQALVVRNMEVMIGDQEDYGCSAAQSLTFTLANEKQDILDICEESGKSGTVARSRTATVDVVMTLQKHDADKFRRFREASDVAFAFNFGSKSGTSWEAGKCGCLYIPVGKLISYKVSDNNSLVVIEASIQAYVDNAGNGEVYLNFV